MSFYYWFMEQLTDLGSKCRQFVRTNDLVDTVEFEDEAGEAECEAGNAECEAEAGVDVNEWSFEVEAIDTFAVPQRVTMTITNMKIGHFFMS